MWVEGREDGCLRIRDYNGKRVADAMNLNSAVIFMLNYRKYEAKEFNLPYVEKRPVNKSLIEKFFTFALGNGGI